jgi:hypothetical protein
MKSLPSASIVAKKRQQMAIFENENRCSGSLDPSVVKLEIDSIVTSWKDVAPLKSNAFSDARQKVGPCESSEKNVHLVQAQWVLKGLPPPDSMFSLSASNISLERLQKFLRFIESIIIDERLPSILGYWSRQSVVQLLPSGRRYTELMDHSYSILIFEENKKVIPNQWCFFVEASSLCLVLHGIT